MHGLSLVPATTVATFEEWIVWVQHKFQIYGKTANTFLILNSRIFIQWQSKERINIIDYSHVQISLSCIQMQGTNSIHCKFQGVESTPKVLFCHHSSHIHKCSVFFCIQAS